MPRHHLLYWRWDTVQFTVYPEEDCYLEHIASDQLKHVDIGDVVWIVTTNPERRLYLVGRIVVAWKGGQREAARELGAEPEELWEADWHVIAPIDHVEPCDLIDITSIAADLRFVSETDRLTIGPEGRINPQQLQTKRVLQPETAQLLEDVWYQGDSISEEVVELTDEELDQVYPEGRRKLQMHYRRERNPKLVHEAKRAFKARHGRLYCEVCGFDFGAVYGELGEDFIEAHHRQPLSEIETDLTESTIDDLHMVCANCHRMIHRRKPWLSIEELQAMLKV